MSLIEISYKKHISFKTQFEISERINSHGKDKREEYAKMFYTIVSESNSDEEIQEKLKKFDIKFELTESQIEALDRFESMASHDIFDEEEYLKIIKEIGINRFFPETRKYGNTLLKIALRFEQEELIKLLLENGADPNQRSLFDDPPLWDLMYCDDKPEYGLRVARMLLEHGADPNAEWDRETLYNYADCRVAADLINSQEEFDYNIAFTDLLEEFGGIIILKTE